MLTRSKRSVNMSCYYLPPCLSINFLLKTPFQVIVFECLIAGNIELGSSESWMGMGNFFWFLFFCIPQNGFADHLPSSSPCYFLDNQ